MQPLSALRRFWSEPVRAEPLAAFRIVAGVTIALSVIFTVAWDLPLYFTDSGLIPGATADAVLARNGGFSLLRGPGGAFGPVLDTPWGAAVLVGLLLTALAFVIVGKKTRIAAGVAFVILAGFMQRSLTLTNGGDDLAVHGLFYLMIAPVAATWAFERTARADGDGVVRVAPWALRLMQLQLCLIYFATALSKVHGSGPHDWLSGEAVYWALNDVTLTRWSYAAVPVPLSICRLMSWGTLAFEFAFIALVWIPRVRPWLLLAGVGLHLGIWASMQVGSFSPHMLMFYVLFVPPQTLARVSRRLPGVRWRPRAPVTA